MLTFIELKNKLLSTNQFFDCQELDDYCTLIIKNYNTEKLSGKTDKHHILPESLFNKRDTKENNSDNCVVNLFFKDHALAHYYLWSAANEDSEQKYYNAGAFNLISHYKLPNSITELLDSLPKIQLLREYFIEQTRIRQQNRQVSESTRQKLSKSLRGKKLTEKHKAALRKPKSTTVKMKKPKSKQAVENIRKAHIGKSNGPHTIETKLKISKTLLGHPVSDFIKEKSKEANLGKKCLYKNGIYKWFYSSEDINAAISDGWIIKGKPLDEERKIALKQAHSGRVWVNKNGILKQIKKEELDAYLAIGYKRGKK